jgi:tetratricopeptide (TPR) repeat protein
MRMRRSALMVVGLALVLPATVQAQQEPSNTLHTRSMTLYLTEARNAGHPDDKASALAKALEVGLEGAREDADNPQVWFLLGQVQLEKGDLAAADSALDRAEALWPDYRQETAPLREAAWVQSYNQGVHALQGGDQATALAAFQRAVDIFDGRPEALLSLASLQAAAGRGEQAAESYRQVLTIVRGPGAAQLSDEVKAEWLESEEVAAFNLARLLADQQQFEEAARVFAEFSERHPDNVQAKVNLGLMYSQAGRGEDAAQIYADLLEQPGLDEIDYFNLGVGLYRAEQPARAAAAFAKAVEANPYGRDALYNLAQAQFAHASDLLEAGDTAAAVTAFAALGATAEQLLALDPAAQQGYMLLAQSQRSRAQLGGEAALRDAALATLEKASQLPFRVESVRMETDDGKATISGSVVNGATRAAGTEARLVVTVVDRSGAELGSQTVAVPLGEQDTPVAFSAEIPVQGEVAGWKYTLAR